MGCGVMVIVVGVIDGVRIMDNETGTERDSFVIEIRCVE